MSFDEFSKNEVSEDEFPKKELFEDGLLEDELSKDESSKGLQDDSIRIVKRLKINNMNVFFIHITSVLSLYNRKNLKINRIPITIL